MSTRTIILLCFVFVKALVFAQNPVADSLLQLLKTTQADTTRIQVLNHLFLQNEFSDQPKAAEYLQDALALSKKIGYKKGLAKTYTHMGYFAEDKGSYNDALTNYRLALDIQLMINDKKGLADSYNNVGNVFYFQANYPEAFSSYFKSLKIKELLKDKIGIANAYSNIGLVYFSQKSYSEALKNYSVCLKMYEELNDNKGIAIAYDHIGLVYYYLADYKLALKNYNASLKLFEEMGEQRRLAGAYNNIGGVYVDLKNYEEGLKSYFTALKLRDKNDIRGIADSYGNIGIALLKQKKYSQATPYLNDSKNLLKKIGSRGNLQKAYTALSYLDSATGNYKGAYENYKISVLYSDSLDNETTRRKTIQSQMNYDFEKKEAIAKAEYKKELESQTLIADEKSRKQRLVLILVSCFLVLVVLFAGFIFRSLRLTRKQKQVIEIQKQLVEQQKQEVEHQKIIVEEHQKAIIDSITYARRIQQSLLPTEKYIEKQLNRLMK